MYIVELQPGVWLAPWTGDPGRTQVKFKARQYDQRSSAKCALTFARKYRAFEDARITSAKPITRLGWGHPLSVWVDGTPKAQPRASPSRSKTGVYTPKTADAWKAAVWARFMPLFPKLPLNKPLRVDCGFYLPRPKRFTALVQDAYGGNVPDGPVIMPSVPDRDNLDKAVLDALTDKPGRRGLWRDDCLVCSGLIQKFYHAKDGKPGALIKVYSWGNIER